jgi:hypothetical protein
MLFRSNVFGHDARVQCPAGGERSDMSRGLPWAATSVPEIRRQWCNALAATIQRHQRSLQTMPAEVAIAEREPLERLQANMVDAIAFVQAEANALGGARLYWVSRDMVELAMSASKTLPSWTPAEAAPAASGLLCWAKPAGLVPYGQPAAATRHVAWDGVWWWTRPDGILQLQPASRFLKAPELLHQYLIKSPMWAAGTSIFLDPQNARTEEANGAEDMHPFISVVGAAWLLMSQPNIAETRDTEPAAPSPSPTNERATVTVPLREPSSVTIVEMRRNLADYKRSAAGSGRRQYRGRWLVGWPNGYWRQQRYGPGGSLRKPILIAPHTAGPKGAALMPPKERVFVWRR